MWQTIDTAPKDGTRVLVYSPNDKQVHIGVRKTFFDKTRRYEIFRDEENAPGHTWSVEPSHWAPLPDGPK